MDEFCLKFWCCGGRARCRHAVSSMSGRPQPLPILFSGIFSSSESGTETVCAVVRVFASD